MKLVGILLFVGTVAAYGVPQPQAPSSYQPTNYSPPQQHSFGHPMKAYAPSHHNFVPIKSFNQVLKGSQYNSYQFQTGNGIQQQETTSNNGGYGGLVQSGSVSYTSPEGTPIRLSWVADKDGFKPVGDHLPKSPLVSGAQPMTSYQAQHTSYAPASPSYQPMQTYQVPATPSYQAPAMPSYQAPPMQSYQAPATPSYQAPPMQSYQAPATPSYQAPPMQSYQAPATPTYQAPPMQSYQAPATPSYAQAPAMSYQQSPPTVTVSYQSQPEQTHSTAAPAPTYSTQAPPPMQNYGSSSPSAPAPGTSNCGHY